MWTVFVEAFGVWRGWTIYCYATGCGFDPRTEQIFLWHIDRGFGSGYSWACGFYVSKPTHDTVKYATNILKYATKFCNNFILKEFPRSILPVLLHWTNFLQKLVYLEKKKNYSFIYLGFSPSVGNVIFWIEKIISILNFNSNNFVIFWPIIQQLVFGCLVGPLYSILPPRHERTGVARWWASVF